MTDRYESFKDLAANTQPEIDYRIRIADRGTNAVILAPHGGTIEPGTAEIAEVIAGTELSFYAFEALKSGAHSEFHITSHRFDEPSALDLVGRSHIAVAIHGRKDDGNDTVWLGGRAKDLGEIIRVALHNAGFKTIPDRTFPGIHKLNICNRTRSGKGVQLELPRSLRRRLAADQTDMKAFSEAIRNSIQSTCPEGRLRGPQMTCHGIFPPR